MVGDSGSGTLIEQWNGTSWAVVPSPNPAGAVFNSLAAAHKTFAQFDQAIEAFRTAARLDPSFAVPVENLAFTLIMADRLDEAASEIARASVMRPDLVGLRRLELRRRAPTPLDRALGELATANGDSGRRRRALEQLAREIEPIDPGLSAESRVLAWGGGLALLAIAVTALSALTFRAYQKSV